MITLPLFNKYYGLNALLSLGFPYSADYSIAPVTEVMSSSIHCTQFTPNGLTICPLNVVQLPDAR